MSKKKKKQQLKVISTSESKVCAGCLKSCKLNCNDQDKNKTSSNKET